MHACIALNLIAEKGKSVFIHETHRDDNTYGCIHKFLVVQIHFVSCITNTKQRHHGHAFDIMVMRLSACMRLLSMPMFICCSSA